jgi:hypothetical protein
MVGIWGQVIEEEDKSVDEEDRLKRKQPFSGQMNEVAGHDKTRPKDKIRILRGE